MKHEQLENTVVIDRINHYISLIDRLITVQLNEILHHSQFQALEASWRGLEYLTETVSKSSLIFIKIISIPWPELARDFARCSDIEDSFLFKKIYNEEFGMPGGVPYGIMLCDYQIHHRAYQDHKIDDIAVLTALSSVGAAAFVPMILNASPRIFGLDSFLELERVKNLSQSFQNSEFLRYQQLRKKEDSRFLGLVLPRILMRQPYGPESRLNLPFIYREDLNGLSHDEFCWGSAVYAFGETVIRAFEQFGWFADICGAKQDEISYGIVAGVENYNMETDAISVVPRIGSEVVISSKIENDLGETGFIGLAVCKDTELLVFKSVPSIQQPLNYSSAAANANAHLSIMLPYILCVSRFAHYIKVQMRDKIGTYKTAAEIEQKLQNWLFSYSTANDNLPLELKARYPLRESKVEVREISGRPGNYSCVLHLQPHYRVEQVAATFKLSMKIIEPT
ncbi:type VI secretion system contractile sheath large subunit [Candidatus Woesearchaeota archaeon]|nr:type VI secretion system contractile sheath large subunit [Candidatus Woesearchaeota archaeon]